LEFIRNKASFLDDISDATKIDAAFTRDFIGRYAYLPITCAEVRAHLDEVVSTHPFDWYGDPAIGREIEKFARSKYSQGGSEKVVAAINNMPQEKLKQWLEQLVVDNMNVGIEILAEGV
jgi:hypothetical protein